MAQAAAAEYRSFRSSVVRRPMGKWTLPHYSRVHCRRCGWPVHQPVSVEAVRSERNLSSNGCDTYLPGIDFLTQYDDWLAIKRNQPGAGALSRCHSEDTSAMGGISHSGHIDVLYQRISTRVLDYVAATRCERTTHRCGLGVPLNPGTRT